MSPRFAIPFPIRFGRQEPAPAPVPAPVPDPEQAQPSGPDPETDVVPDPITDAIPDAIPDAAEIFHDPLGPDGSADDGAIIAEPDHDPYPEPIDDEPPPARQPAEQAHGETRTMEPQPAMYEPTKENSMSDTSTIESLEQQLSTLYGERESLNERYGVSSFEEISRLIESLESQLCDLYGRQPNGSAGGGGGGLMDMLDQIDQISPRLDPSYSQKRVTITLENSTPVLRAEWIENLK